MRVAPENRGPWGSKETRGKTSRNPIFPEPERPMLLQTPSRISTDPFQAQGGRVQRSSIFVVKEKVTGSSQKSSACQKREGGEAKATPPTTIQAIKGLTVHPLEARTTDRPDK